MIKFLNTLSKNLNIPLNKINIIDTYRIQIEDKKYLFSDNLYEIDIFTEEEIINNSNYLNKEYFIELYEEIEGFNHRTENIEKLYNLVCNIIGFQVFIDRIIKNEGRTKFISINNEEIQILVKNDKIVFKDWKKAEEDNIYYLYRIE